MSKQLTSMARVGNELLWKFTYYQTHPDAHPPALSGRRRPLSTIQDPRISTPLPTKHQVLNRVQEPQGLLWTCQTSNVPRTGWEYEEWATRKRTWLIIISARSYTELISPPRRWASLARIALCTAEWSGLLRPHRLGKLVMIVSWRSARFLVASQPSGNLRSSST